MIEDINILKDCSISTLELSSSEDTLKMLLLVVLACLASGALSQALCGTRPNTRIVGGQAAQHGDWPWQAMLLARRGKLWGQFCGGALVSPEWIVTASHCVDRKKNNQIKVRLGAYKRNGLVGTEQDFKVTKIIMHESYGSPISYSHDIALLKLEKPAMFSRHIHPVCLPASISDVAPGTNCYITGWGTTSSGGSAPDVLHQATVPIVSQAECLRSYPNQIHDSMICAGLQEGGVDACQGDSGGPMVCESGGRFFLHGATSWGYGCAYPDKYGVYARVKYLHSWIQNKMNSS